MFQKMCFSLENAKKNELKTMEREERRRNARGNVGKGKKGLRQKGK